MRAQEELLRRQEELERKAAELDRREREMQSLSASGGELLKPVLFRNRPHRHGESSNTVRYFYTTSGTG